MKHIDLNQATYVGIDCHPSEHTALAVNRFEEEKGRLTFDNSWEGVKQFLAWLPIIEADPENVLIGLEGRGGKGSGFIASILKVYEGVYEINPQYTKQRRQFGTRGGKSDIRDARCIAEVLIRHLPELPLIIPGQITTRRLLLNKLVWYYDELTKSGARLKNHIAQLEREYELSIDHEEKKLLAELLREQRADLKRITGRRRALRGRLGKLIEGYESNLCTIPGIAEILAAEIGAYSDDMERFANVDKYLSYSGIAPLEKASGKTKRAVQNHKGNRSLNRTLYLTAICQVRYNGEAKAYYQRKIAEGKTRKHALRCVMKRIAMIIYGMLRSGKPYDAEYGKKSPATAQVTGRQEVPAVVV